MDEPVALVGPNTTTESTSEDDVAIVLRRVWLTVNDPAIRGVSCEPLALTNIELEGGFVWARLAPEDIPVLRAWLDRQEVLCV